jgi:hypothetical protein
LQGFYHHFNGDGRKQHNIPLQIFFFLASLSLCFRSVGSNLLVILFEGCKIFTGFGEFSLLHTLTNVPVNEGSLGIHEVELVVNSLEHLSNGGGVGKHQKSSVNLGQITSWDRSRGLGVESTLESSGTPIDELDGSLSLHNGNSRSDILRNDVSSVHETASHVLSVSGIAFGHHVGGLKDGVGELRNRELFMVGLVSRNDGSIRAQHKVDSGIWHQVGLELIDIHVKASLKTERGGQRGNELSDQSVKIGVIGLLNIQRPSANVVDGLVVQEEGNIGVFQQGVSRKNGVVGLHNGSGQLGRGINAEIELGFLSVINGETFEQQRTESRASSSTNRVENEETLEASAAIGNLADSLKGKIHKFLSDGVVTSGIVVGRIFLAREQLVRVEELSVGAISHFVHDGGFKINVDGTRDMLSTAGLGEEGTKGILFLGSGSLIRGTNSIGGNSMLQAVQLPAGVSELNTGLSNVNGDDFSHDCLREKERGGWVSLR